MVGGIAVSLRTIERFTKDVDFAISVDSDFAANQLVHSFRNAGFNVEWFLEDENDGKLLTVRLRANTDIDIFVDLLIATSGIEREVIENATEMEPFPGINVKLATISSLLAMKVLSADWKIRPQDVLDIQQLLEVADQEDIAKARRLLDLITERGYNRSKDLQADLDKYTAQFNS